ncbi:hypothetical protein GGF41_003551 [Coemansia sp. RSA 2531]|nr:hypothetical protein GGF41_003551 [Coemansia sp. RSA 2531]
MDAYLGVLSRAWSRVYPQLEAQLETARVQVPAEYRHMLKILSITGVPSTYDQEWARGFVDNAQRIGPTTIYAKDIEGAMDDPAMRPTDVVTTDERGSVATITNAPMERPTIVVAVNGNVRAGHEAVEGSSSREGGGSSEGSSSGSSGSSERSSSSSSDGPLRIPLLTSTVMMFGLISAAASFF